MPVGVKRITSFLYYDRIIPESWLKEKIKKPDTLWQLRDKSVIPFPLKKR